MYLLGVDGGGTKIEFLLTDLECKEQFNLKIYENCNLKYSSAQKIIQTLEQGFAKIVRSGVDFSQIQYAYLGIAECGPNGVGKGRPEILDFLQKKFENYTLADDQYSVFRAGAPTNFGMLANAGTGSNINNFGPTQDWSYKSIGIGGRDFGKMILGELIYGGLDKTSQVYQIIASELGQSPEEFYSKLEPMAKIKDEFIPKIPKLLISNLDQNPKLKDELKVYEVFLANRWSTKISAYARINFGYDFQDEFDLVLSGSMWKWDSMRYIMIEDLKRIFKNINVIFDPNLRPVEGCVEVAYEKSCMD